MAPSNNENQAQAPGQTVSDAEGDAARAAGPNGGSVLRQTAWYLFAGGSAALIELALFQALYALAGLGVAVANVVAVVVATAYNFAVNRNVTFKSTSNPVRSMVLYIALFLVNLTITTLAISAMVDMGVHSAVAKVIMQVLVVCWNFVLYRKVIFR